MQVQPLKQMQQGQLKYRTEKSNKLQVATKTGLTDFMCDISC